MILAGIDQSLAQIYHEHNRKNCQTCLPAEVEWFSELIPDLTQTDIPNPRDEALEF